MKKNRISILFFLLTASVSFVSSADKPYVTPPPIPQQIVEHIQKAGHPFLMAGHNQFRQTTRLIRTPLMIDRGREFMYRIPSYFNSETPWYLGEGPFGGKNEFHPLMLSDEDMRFYAKIACEVIAYTGMDNGTAAVNRVMNEVVRILDEIQPARTINSIGLTQQEVSQRQAYLTALCAIMYDTVYQRFGTIERNQHSGQLKQIRERLAAYCASLQPEDIPIADRIVYGSALGLSTLMCVSVYSLERKDRDAVSAQSMLPDLYRAISLSSNGMYQLSGSDHQLSLSLEDMESVLLIAVPWTECLKRLGYPFEIQQGAYSELIAVLESHRIPGSSFAVFPSMRFPLSNPWIPYAHPLFWQIDERMYSKITKEPVGLSLPTEPDKTETPPEDGFGVPETVKEKKESLLTGKPLSLADQLRLLELPQRKKTAIEESPDSLSRNTAGWRPPAGLETPSLWGALYLLAQRENASSLGGRLWEDIAQETDSHPYTYLYYTQYPISARPQSNGASLIQNPTLHSSVLSNRTRFGDYILAVQSATGTVLMATATIDHESFVMADNSKEWRWFHAIPCVTNSQPPSHPASSAIQLATPILTDLYSYWQTTSPTGRTLAVRRHISGVGGGYTVIAHFPDSNRKSGSIENVVFSMPDMTNATNSEEGPGQFSIAPILAPEEETIGYSILSKIDKKKKEASIDTLTTGTLNVVFSPDSIKEPVISETVIGHTAEVELAHTTDPFFYLLAVSQQGREMFDVKYDTLTTPGLRIIEWQEGIELIAIRHEDGIKNEFIESDADFIIVTRNRPMDAMNYLMVNGTYLRCKFSPTQREDILLISAKGKRLSAACANRRIFTSEPPPNSSIFYAPKLLAFDCPGYVVNYGIKGRTQTQAVVWRVDEASNRPTGRIRYVPRESQER